MTQDRDGTAYDTRREEGSVIEWHDWGNGNPWARTVECVFCGADLRRTKLSVHLLDCEDADREVRY